MGGRLHAFHGVGELLLGFVDEKAEGATRVGEWVGNRGGGPRRLLQ